jgi:hypothetical protein
MANFTQTLTDSINCFGPQPSTKFGTSAIFGTDLFGNGGVDFTIILRIIQGAVSNSMSLTDNTGFIYLTDGSWYFNFTGSSNDFNATTSTYTAATKPSNTWTLQTTSSTTWIKS